ncbi:hypothetical protein GCM10007908_02810 [Rhizobium albus]|nr:hypothetical protein GCM10007908_02810 [Rhizobium albus]
MTILLLAIHVLATVFWVGGMAFAYLVLRPAAAPLDPAARLTLWRNVFAKFLPAVGWAVIALLVTGFAMTFVTFGGFAGAPVSVHVMTLTGILMMLLFFHIVAAPWKRFRTAIDAGDFAQGARNLDKIRKLVGMNLVLGLLTVVIATTGRYW